MGCGAGKTSKESILNSHIPAPSAPRSAKQGGVAPPGNKLAPEVLEGFERLLKRFARVEVKAKAAARTAAVAREKNGTKKPAEEERREVRKPVEKEVPQNEAPKETAPEQKPAALPSEPPAPEESKVDKIPTLPSNPVITKSPTVKVPSESVPEQPSAAPVAEPEVQESPPVPEPAANMLVEGESLPIEPRQAFGEDAFPHAEEQRFSPEPPRPATLSDEEEAQPYEDENLRRERMEKERLALEEAERLAALQRAEVDQMTLAQRGKMTSMENQANDILAKYR